MVINMYATVTAELRRKYNYIIENILGDIRRGKTDTNLLHDLLYTALNHTSPESIEEYNQFFRGRSEYGE